MMVITQKDNTTGLAAWHANSSVVQRLGRKDGADLSNQDGQTNGMK